MLYKIIYVESNKKRTPVFIAIAVILFFALCLLIFIVVCKSPQGSPQAPKIPNTPRLSVSFSISEMHSKPDIPFVPKISTTVSVTKPNLVTNALNASNRTEISKVKPISEQKLTNSIMEIPDTPSLTNINANITPIAPSPPLTLAHGVKTATEPAVELIDVYKDRLIDYNEITINLGFKNIGRGTVMHFTLQNNDNIHFNSLNDYFVNPKAFSYIPQDDNENILLNIVVEKTGTYNINLSLDPGNKTIYKLITIDAYN